MAREARVAVEERRYEEVVAELAQVRSELARREQDIAAAAKVQHSTLGRRDVGPLLCHLTIRRGCCD